MSFALLAFCVSATLPSVPDFSCTEADVLCWKRMVLWYRGQQGIASDLLELERRKSVELEASTKALRTGFEQASTLAEKLGEQAIKRGERSWSESPALWSSVTAVVVAALAIGIAQGFKVSLDGR